MSNKQHEHMIIGMCFCLNTISLIFIYIYICIFFIYKYIYTKLIHMKCVCAIRILLLRDVRPRHPGLELLLSLGQQALAEVLRDLVVGQGPELLRPGQL